jgi:hypothetical protein
MLVSSVYIVYYYTQLLPFQSLSQSIICGIKKNVRERNTSLIKKYSHVTAPYSSRRNMWQPIHTIRTFVHQAVFGGGDGNNGETKKQQQQQQQDNNIASFTIACIRRHCDRFVKPLILLAVISVGTILATAASHELVSDLKNNMEDYDCNLCAANSNNINKSDNYYYKKPTPIPPPTHLFEFGSRAIYTKDGAVNVFDFDRINAAWIPRGQPIQEKLKDYAGWSLSLSRDGNSLSIASVEETSPTYYGSSKTSNGNKKRSPRVFEYHVDSNSWVLQRGGPIVDDENASSHVVLDAAQFIMEIPEHGYESEGISVTRFA